MQDNSVWCGLPRLSKYLAALAIALCCWHSPLPVSAQQPEAPLTLTLRGDEAPETIRKLVDALSAGGRKVEIKLTGGQGPAAGAPAPAAVAEPATAPIAPPSMADTRLEMIWNSFVNGFDYGNAAIPQIVRLPADWEQAWAKNSNGTTGPSALLRGLADLAVALAVGLLFRRATRGWFRRRLQPAGESFTARMAASASGLAQDLACILLGLAVARILRQAWLPTDDLAMVTFRTIANGMAIGAAYIAVGRFLLAPGAPERRLLPLPRADRHFALLTIYAIATPIVISASLLVQHAQTSPETAAGFIALTGFATMLFTIWWFFDARHDLKALVLRYQDTPGPALRLLAAITPWFYIASAIGIWAVGRAAPMMDNGGRWAGAAGQTQFIIVLAPIIAVGVSSLLASREAHRASLGDRPPLATAVGRALSAGAGGIVWAGSLYLMARLWAGFLLGVSSTEFADFTRQAAGVAILVFGGWVVLVFLRAFFDAYTPKHVAIMPGDEDTPHHDNVPSRLATVLPVLRGVVLSAVIGLTSLVVLSRLGVDIGPLLAGFGILGLAISFGSQALVRDIVSGFFFMLEDAFRVGEYVDNGRLKGTVEKISLRSMQLRHQSGQIHTVPFGQIASLTNSSRDWATVKFNVRLDHSADIEQARKTIKKTGQALLEDPEFGPHFLAPLKMQGVADITDSAVVIRLKFTAKPNQASGVQREALKRIYRALNDAKVPFASNAVTVRGGEGQYQGGAAAAISAVPPPSPFAPMPG